MDSKRKGYEPSTTAQYYESIADCMSFNDSISRQRAYDRKRRTIVQTEGYEAVLNRSKRTQLAFNPYTTPIHSNSGMLSTSSAASLNSLKPLNNQIPPQQKSQQNILPMSDSASKQLAPKLAKATPTPPVHLKPMESQLPKQDTLYSIGSEVMVQHTDKLAAYGLAHLIGKKGKVITVPAAKGQFLYGVMFDSTLQHVPLEALVAADSVTTTGQMKLNAASQLKLEHSFHMHRLMQDQFKEIQALQKQHSEYRVANNTTAMTEVQKSLSVLRNLHLSQIRLLKSKQEEELRQKELN